ncbi:prohibitin family protein [Xanthomonas phage JGB6]|nr:prohibitin family protein [Xanthomonas phage JGB6]
MKVTRVDSSDDNVCKYVFDMGTAVAEAVLYKYPEYNERTVICCSTQSGCPIGCRFCGAGDAFVRNLTTEEIVAQVEHLFADKAIDPSAVKRGQIMFMSMGEPLLNLKQLIPAMATLANRYPNFALLISTSAPRVDFEPLFQAAEVIPQIGLQFSVHESTDAARDALIPFKNKYTIAEIAGLGNEFFHRTDRQAFFNYCAHADNTSEADAVRLANTFPTHSFQATVSVICERDESIAAANERQRTLATNFMSRLLDYGYSVRTFDPAGQDDIGGGCGQLWYVQDWMQQHPDLARPSVGRGLPAVHTPRVIESTLVSRKMAKHKADGLYYVTPAMLESRRTLACGLARQQRTSTPK